MSFVQDGSRAGGVQSEEDSSEWYGSGKTVARMCKCTGDKDSDFVKKRLLFTEYLGSPG